MRTTAAIGICALALATAGCDAVPVENNPGSSVRPTTGQAAQWVMPNLVGTVLQDAQDQIQRMTAGAIYFTDSHDVSGQGRHQVADDNWRVCDQNVPPGTTLTSTSKIDFGVVKLDETCP